MSALQIAGKALRHGLLALMPLGFLAAALAGTVATDPTVDRTCSAQWCQNGRQNAYTEGYVRDMIDGQLAALGCDRTKRLAPRVAVRNAKGYGKGVVRVVTFDAAWNAAKSGDVWVEGYCG